MFKNLRKRKKYLIKKAFQLKFAAVIIFAILITIALVGWDVYYTIGALLMERGRDPYLLSFIKSFNALLLKKVPLLMMFIVFLSIFISHEISGPVYHLEKSIKKIRLGDLTEIIRLRKGDELQELAGALNDMTEGLRKIVLKDKDKIGEISYSLEMLKDKAQKENLGPSEIKALKSEIERINKELQNVGSGLKV
ncbi:MAG: methyl-accepting chemotaxis protein [bacterium]